MTPNSVIAFSTRTNQRYRHQIILDLPRPRLLGLTPTPQPQPRWLGVTFRVSKTFIKYVDRPYFSDTEDLAKDSLMLMLANDAQRAQFYQLRQRENAEIGFNYPRLNYTISPSDLIQPVETDDGVEKEETVAVTPMEFFQGSDNDAIDCRHAPESKDCI